MLKSDSSLLNGRKPFFSPEGTNNIAAHPCLVCRIGRMGKHIEPRFAWRYIDGIAPGLHIEDADRLAAARQKRTDWVLATAMDGSMPVGEFTDTPAEEEHCLTTYTYRLYKQVSDISEGCPTVEYRLVLNDKAEDIVALLSKTITLRQGDLIFIGADTEPLMPQVNNCIVAYNGTEDLLFCKIK